MELPLKHRVGENEFSYLANTGKELIYILTKIYLSVIEIEVVSVKDYTADIFVWKQNQHLFRVNNNGLSSIVDFGQVWNKKHLVSVE